VRVLNGIGGLTPMVVSPMTVSSSSALPVVSSTPPVISNQAVTMLCVAGGGLLLAYGSGPMRFLGVPLAAYGLLVSGGMVI